MCMYPYPSQSIEDNTITLRFAFTINSSFNGNVGIVYSFSNQNPTLGVTNCTSSAASVLRKAKVFIEDPLLYLILGGS